jgi:phosphatidylcholine synthase
MASTSGTLPPESITFGQSARAYFVHVYTASGLVFAFLAAAEICSRGEDPRPAWVFLWLTLAVLVDATDGPLARLWHVTTRAPRFDGRKIDDIVDYLTFTFIPLLLVWRMEWLPSAAEFLIPAALIASVLGFSNTLAKQEDEGFFLGFPSYWNIYAFFVGLWSELYGGTGQLVSAILLGLLTMLTVAPVRFVYPNLASPPWKVPMLAGGGVWLVILWAMLPIYPDEVPGWLHWLSLVYPVFYIIVSIYLDVRESHAERSSGVVTSSR